MSFPFRVFYFIILITSDYVLARIYTKDGNSQNSVTNYNSENMNKIITEFHSFLHRKSNNQERGRQNIDIHENKTHWEKIQEKRIHHTTHTFNSSVMPHKDHFSYHYWAGVQPDEIDHLYDVGSVSKYFGELLQSLPSFSLPKLTNFWNFLLRDEEKNLYAKLHEEIQKGEPLYTNRPRKADFLYDAIESHPWWHGAVTFCTNHGKPEFDANYFVCNVVFDLGLTIFMKLVFLRDLVVCTILTAISGDLNICLAMYITKLAFPGLIDGDRETPWITNNVHLDHY